MKSNKTMSVEQTRKLMQSVKSLLPKPSKLTEYYDANQEDNITKESTMKDTNKKIDELILLAGKLFQQGKNYNQVRDMCKELLDHDYGRFLMDLSKDVNPEEMAKREVENRHGANNIAGSEDTKPWSTGVKNIRPMSVSETSKMMEHVRNIWPKKK